MGWVGHCSVLHSLEREKRTGSDTKMTDQTHNHRPRHVTCQLLCVCLRPCDPLKACVLCVLGRLLVLRLCGTVCVVHFSLPKMPAAYFLANSTAVCVCMCVCERALKWSWSSCRHESCSVCVCACMCGRRFFLYVSV